jgi:hypothetical protein
MGGVGAVEQARATIRVRSGGKPASWCLLVLFEGCRQGYSPYETQVDGLPIWGMSVKGSKEGTGSLAVARRYPPELAQAPDNPLDPSPLAVAEIGPRPRCLVPAIGGADLR